MLMRLLQLSTNGHNVNLFKKHNHIYDQTVCDFFTRLNKLALVIIILFVFNVNNIKCQSARLSLDEKLKKINEASQQMLSRITHTQKDYLSFLSRIDGFDLKNYCPSLTQSDLQAKIKKFKSIISECPGYKVCKIGMRSNGTIYGELDQRLETILNITEVSDEYLLRQPSLFGSHYIKFVYADKYLCINRHHKLVSSNSPKKECLWFTNNRPITSAFNKEISLQFQSTPRECKISTSLSTSRAFEQSQMQSLLNRDKCSLKIDSANLLDIYAMSKNCFDFSSSANKQKQPTNPNKITKAITTTTTTPLPTTTTTTTTTPTKPKFTNEKIFKQTTRLIKQSNHKPNLSPIRKFKKEDYLDANNLIVKIKALCSDYLQDELIYKKKLNSIEYFYASKFSSAEIDSNNLPAFCAEFMSLLNKSDNTQLDPNNVNNNNKNFDYFNYYYNSVEKISPITSTITSSTISSKLSKFKFKKCYEYRNTPFYKQCMNVHYKCYQFNNDVENLKKCRKNNGITVPTRKYNMY